MSKRQILILLGVWVGVLPFLGFPSAWSKIILPVSGVLIVIVALGNKVQIARQERDGTPYVDYRNDKPKTDKIIS